MITEEELPSQQQQPETLLLEHDSATAADIDDARLSGGQQQ